MIARKLNEGIATRSQAISKQYTISRKCWEEQCKSTEQFVESYRQMKEQALAKKAKGEKLSKTEEMYADVNIDEVRQLNSTTFPEFMKRQGGQLFHYFGFNEELYKKYYQDNYNYFYAKDPFGYDLDVDEDARDLGIANNDIKLIDTAISLIEKNESAKDQPQNPYRQSKEFSDYQMGKRILDRYTLVRFETAKEYRDWFTKYKDKMFFTDSGGWLWLINTQDKSVPGNDYKVRPDFHEHIDRTFKADGAAAPAPKGPRGKRAAAVNRDNPVAYVARYDAQKHEIVIEQTIFEGFHTYASLGKDDPFILTEVEITLNGGEKVGELKKPAAKPFEGGKATIYEGFGEFRQAVKGSGEATITIHYQACDASMCHMPKDVTLKVKF